MRHAAQRQAVPSLLAALIAALALLALAVAPGSAGAYEAYQHGPIEDCETCHESAHTDRTPLSFVCFTCHADYQVVRSGDVCWTCHTPGQKMDWARTDGGCLSTCHLRGVDGEYDVEFAHTPHAGGSGACTSCHPVAASPARSDGSAHHTIPAPRLDLVSPAAAAPGASVTLTGAKLSWVQLVRFGGVKSAFTVVSDTSLSATVPKDAVTGPVTVLGGGGLATSPADFVVLRPEPPAVTLAASQSVLKLGRRVQLIGRLTPAGAASQVRVVVQRRTAGVWKVAGSALRAVDEAGAYAWSYRPRSTGGFRARSSAAGASSAWVAFRVR